MDINTVMPLLNKYKNCPQCGNHFLSNGEGTLTIEDETFYRSCKCGFSVFVREKESVEE